jgi:RNA 2',3'-cyclic 3'-phosphodiesterase
MRMFFALWPDADTRVRIAQAAEALDRAGHGQRVPGENYHVTLTFVGAVEKSALAVLQQIGRQQRATGCTIKFDAYDYWPQPRVIVAAAREIPQALLDLWAGLRRDLSLQHAPLNDAPLDAPLRPHVTLARKVAQAPVLQAMSPFYWNARSFSLVHSETGGARSVYTVVDTWPLLDEPHSL